MPVGTWVMRTAVSFFCTFWPPAPLERKVSIGLVRVDLLFSLFEEPGMTSTEANEVCRRLFASKGEIRTSRCTPRSALR